MDNQILPLIQSDFGVRNPPDLICDIRRPVHAKYDISVLRTTPADKNDMQT
jgi:hypothetical protein